MSHAPKVAIYRVRKQFQWRVVRGGNIILTPGEQYGSRWKVRRSIKALADMCTDDTSSSWVSPLQAACLLCLDDDARDFEAKTGLYAK